MRSYSWKVSGDSGRKQMPARILVCLALAGTSGCSLFYRIDPSEPGSAPVAKVSGAPARNLYEQCVANFDPEIDYFPDKSTFHYARQLRVQYHKNYKVVEFHPSVNTQETFRYVLVQCGTPAPKGYSRAEIVSVPSQRFVLNTPGYGDTVQRLGIAKQLVGVLSLAAYTTPEILARGAAGLIHEVGSRSHSNLEPTIAINPDLVFLFYSAYPNANLHPKLAEMGVKGIPLADHFEPHPLGRSEWVKFFALLFNREREAESIFQPAAARYEQLRTTAATVSVRPDVLLGWPSGRDVWALMGGRNYMSNLVWDAGGRYFWTDNEAGSLVSADFEKVMDQSLETEVWLGGFGVVRVPDRKRLVQNEARLAFFTPVERGGVYASDRGLDKRGAIPFSSGNLDKPDAVLADVIAAIHPGLLPNHKSVYYRKLN
jgi:iron complex transport system substrate-binding protein